MAFEKYERSSRGRRSLGFPHVSLHRSGVFGLSWQAYGLLGEPSHCAFHYDGERRRVGIEMVAETDANSYKVHGKKRGARLLHGVSFCGRMGIEFGDRVRRWRVELVDGMLVFCVKDEL